MGGSNKTLRKTVLGSTGNRAPPRDTSRLPVTYQSLTSQITYQSLSSKLRLRSYSEQQQRLALQAPAAPSRPCSSRGGTATACTCLTPPSAFPPLRHQLCASYTPTEATSSSKTRIKLQERCGSKSMAMVRSTAATAVVFVGLMFLGSCHGEQLVAMTHPAPAALGSTLGFGDASLAATTKYYISYGSLDANRAPCPAGAGRSYYTQNCQGSGDVQPYVRSCNQITRCARG